MASGQQQRGIRRGWVVPGFRYLGPGNEVPPVAEDDLCELDAIARQHDLAYDAARSSAEVARADWRAIRDFAKVGVLGLLAGSLLLGKLLLERLTTCFYPGRFFAAMDLLFAMLLVLCLSWIWLLDYRLESEYMVRARRGALPCAQASTWNTLRCLLEQAQQAP
uniref:Putative coat protein n=1 Tax=Vesanto virus TaxID=1955786 RepID=A0A7D5A545_9VIRU|nr:putative coat protein [Vesanto virus]